MMDSNNSDYKNWKEDIIKTRLGGKSEWTDLERMELCLQLDKQFDENFKNIPKCEQKDKWTELNWKEKMSEHPLFAGYLKKDGETIASETALSDGLAQLKFDPEHATAEEIAYNYKEEGNIYYKAKKYQLAIISYTEAIKQNFGEDDFLSRLYNNRSACHYSLGNYRSSLNGSAKAVDFNASYAKSIERAAKCCLKLKLYKECISWCDKGVKISPIEKIMSTLMKQARKEKAEDDAKERRNRKATKNCIAKNLALLNAFKDKKIPIYDSLSLCDVEELEKKLSSARVKLTSSGDLEWDVVFTYPEYSESDLVEEFNEHTSFITQLKLMFDEPPPWDVDNKYQTDRLRLYFADKDSEKLIQVDTKSDLATVLRDDRYQIDALFPTFIVLSENSKYATEFMKKNTK